MKIEYNGFQGETFSGTIDTKPYENFMTRNILKEITEQYQIKKTGLKLESSFELDDDIEVFKTLFLLFQKTSICKEKYGEYDEGDIDLTKVNISYEGEDIITKENELEPRDYLTGSSRKQFGLLSVLIYCLMDRDEDLEKPFHVIVWLGRQKIVIRRSANNESLGHLFHIIHHTFNEGDENVLPKKEIIGDVYIKKDQE